MGELQIHEESVQVIDNHEDRLEKCKINTLDVLKRIEQSSGEFDLF